MHTENFEDLVKKALMLETQQITNFLDNVKDTEIKEKLAFILNDEIQATNFAIKTSTGLKSFDGTHFNVLETGDTIKQFTIIKLIATGGMGCVYLAYDNKLNRNVAIKTIRPEYLDNTISQQRLKQEAQVLSQINHPSICQIYDYIQGDDCDLLVLELVTGVTLNKIKLDSTQKLDIFIKITSGIEIAHSKGVIHRDLKPDNIMVSLEHDVKILDFGIAKSLAKPNKIKRKNQNIDSKKSINDMTTDGSLIGTLLYMSPEQAALQETTKASDIYSLGVMVHELLIGKCIYDLVSTGEFIEQVKDAKVLHIDLLPKEYIALIKLMVDKNPLNRPTAQQVIKELQIIKKRPKQKKYRNRNIMISFLVVSLLGLALYQWNKYNQSGKKADLIQSLKLSINEISNTFQKIYTLPIHDIRNDLKNLSAKKENLLSIINRSNLLLESEKNLYKGKTNFAYKDYKSSLPQLESAWSLGIKTDSLVNALIFNNVKIYYENTIDHYYSQGYEDKEYIQSQEDLYLYKAKKYMQLSNLDTKLNSVPNALLLWHTKELDKAVSVLDQLTKEQDWNFEAYQIQGHILKNAGLDKFETGDVDAALALLNQSKIVFKKASDRGRSYANAYSAICELDTMILRVITVRKKIISGILDKAQEALEACENSLNILPGNENIYKSISEIHIFLSTEKILFGKSPIENIEKAIQASQFIKPEFRKYMTQGNIYNTLADYQESIGLNPLNSYDDSIGAYEKADIVKDNSLDAIYTQIIDVYINKMYYQYNIGIDPLNIIKKLEKIEQKALIANKSSNEMNFQNNINFAIGHAYKGFYDYLQNISPAASVIQTEVYLNKARKFDSKSPSLDIVSVHASLPDIKFKIKNKVNAKGQINKSLARMEYLLKSFPNSPYYMELTAVMLANLEYAKKIENPNYPINLSEAISLYERSLELNPKAFAVYADFAELYFNQAKLAGNKKESLQLGIQNANKSLVLNQTYPFTYFYKANLIDYGIAIGVFSKNREQEVSELYAKAKSINPLFTKGK